ncbi:MAG: hypothetical protein WB770_03890 [Acidimicrobiales bacterium]
MTVERSELSSMAKTIEDLAKRVSQMGDAAQAARDDATAHELYSVERSLIGATRRIARIIGKGRS